ncbi:MAG: ATP-binding protein, partial [Ardenticatenaceae bacterium]
MMLKLTGYQFKEQLYQSANSVVYRAVSEANQQPVILKILSEVYPSPERMAWFKREYEVTHQLKLAGVIDVYDLLQQSRFFMVLEDFGGESFKRLGYVVSSSDQLVDFLDLAIQVSDILGQVHARHIMHKDINPANIVLNQETGQVKLIDFGISTVLSRETTTFKNPNVLEGTLAYISPEQTGRMNRPMDYRTDFYSLGVTFYELLTGQLPFVAHDALELVHCHIAKQPVAPHQIKNTIPTVLSELILKLMAKNAFERYQSALGIRADLEECRRQLINSGEIKPFALAQQDKSDRFQIPAKLYGRGEQIKSLLNAFERVSQGSTEMMLVAGYAGIGKSALVQEVYKPITERHGYFIAGKFDQLQRDIPYSAFMQAFGSLVRQLLTESDAKMAVWREKIVAALGANGQVMIDVIPELRLIIGPQPALPELPPQENQNRFNFVLQNFIKLFTRAEHPLLIFLDDLQWADGASLSLLQLLLTTPDLGHLFVIGAYRDNEVNATHPLMLTLKDCRNAEAGTLPSDATINEITLSGLALPDVTQLIADTLNRLDVTPLAELVLEKTGGNPFFLTAFLNSLHAEKCLHFDYLSGQWQWSLAQIQAQGITSNVVELMASQVQKLPAETQDVLKLAACIGNQFDLETLAIVAQNTTRQTAIDLAPALREGLILPLSDAYKLVELDLPGLSDQVSAEYKFVHDRVQQAVYSLIPEAYKEATHLSIGRLLLTKEGQVADQSPPLTPPNTRGGTLL